MKRVVLILLILALIGINLFLIYKAGLKPAGTNPEMVEFVVSENETYTSISSRLKEANLIKSEFAYKIYLKLSNLKSLEAGKYYLSDTMSVEELVETLGTKSNFNGEVVTITLKEGKNMRAFANLVAEKTDNSADDVYALLKDDEYLDRIIDKYWFLTDEIKNKNIYYSLEGYLFPDTYEIFKNDSVETIIGKMLDNMNKKLEPYKEKISTSSYSIHKLITLASIVELEGASSKDRAAVAGVFYNRLKNGWFLGSDVTTFYAEKMDDWTKGLTYAQLEACNSYNTRGTCFTGLPVGPICNPGLESLISAFEPEEHDYYYFVADCNGKTYLSKNASEHEKTINNLRASGSWCEN